MTEEQLKVMEKRWLPDDVPPLIAEVRRLQGLIEDAELTNGSWHECPWCGEWLDAQEESGTGHKPDCPAFPPV
jgi:hypothetical protein